MEDKLSIKVIIADKQYPLRVDRKDEERIRKAAKLVNERLLRYQQSYVSDKNHSHMAMVAFQFANDFLEVQEKLNQTPIMEELEELNGKLKNHIENSNPENLEDN